MTMLNVYDVEESIAEEKNVVIGLSAFFFSSVMFGKDEFHSVTGVDVGVGVGVGVGVDVGVGVGVGVGVEVRYLNRRYAIDWLQCMDIYVAASFRDLNFSSSRQYIFYYLPFSRVSNVL